MIETLRGLGLDYAIVAAYDAVPGRLAVVAIEKQSTRGRFQAAVAVRCDDRDVELIGGRSAPPPHDQVEKRLRAAWRERGGGRVATPSMAPAAGFDAHVEVLSAAEMRARFGGDVTAAGIVPARVTLANATPRTYGVTVPLIALWRPSGDLVRPLPWADARARLVVSAPAAGWKPPDEVERMLLHDRVLKPGERVDGIVLYPTGAYGTVDVVVIDDRQARAVRVQTALPTTR